MTQIHKRSVQSISIATFGAFFIGYLAGSYGQPPFNGVIGMLLVLIPPRVALWYHPSAEQIATLWNSRTE